MSYSTDSDFYDFVFVFVSVFHDKYQSYKYEKHSREICKEAGGLVGVLAEAPAPLLGEGHHGEVAAACRYERARAF